MMSIASASCFEYIPLLMSLVSVNCCAFGSDMIDMSYRYLDDVRSRKQAAARPYTQLMRRNRHKPIHLWSCFQYSTIRDLDLAKMIFYVDLSSKQTNRVQAPQSAGRCRENTISRTCKSINTVAKCNTTAWRDRSNVHFHHLQRATSYCCFQ